jgi:hypothetical protein
MKRAVFDRTDWHFAFGDSYGATVDDEAPRTPEGLVSTLGPPRTTRDFRGVYTRRPGTPALAGDQLMAWCAEAMFRVGVPVSGDMGFHELVVRKDELRTTIIAEAHKRGFSEVNGKPIEDFVVVRERIFAE